MSTVLFFILGVPGVIFAGKEFADPVFSDWLSPGPGQILLGDAGRLHDVDNAIEKLLLGSLVNKVEGVLLAVATFGIFLSPFSTNLCQFLTCALVPIQAWYYLLNIVYLPLTGAIEGAIISLIVGVALQGLCLWRLSSGFMMKAPTSSKLILNLYILYGMLSVAMAGLMIYRAPEFKDEIEFLAYLREYFWTVNGMVWTAGEDAPDGFKDYLDKLIAESGNGTGIE